MTMADAPKKAGSRERVREFLVRHGLAEEIFEFEQSTKTAQMAADAMGCELGQIVKSLVFVLDDGRHVRLESRYILGAPTVPGDALLHLSRTRLAIVPVR